MRKRKNKVMNILSLLLVLVASVAISHMCYAETSEDGLFYYTILSDGTAQVTGCVGSQTNVTIPSTVDGYTVTSLDDFSSDGIVSITIPTTVKRIEDNAFESCKKLQSVKFLGDGLEYIGKYAFFDCNLQSFQFPSTVKEVGRVAFGYADFESITVPKSVTVWGDGIFFNSSKLRNVVFEEGAITVPDSMFQGCSELTSVKLSNTIQTIEESAFSHVDKITEINIPASVNFIGGWAFYCVDIEKMTVESNDFSIGECAFSGCGITTLYCVKDSPIYDMYADDEDTKIIIIGTYLKKDTLEVRVGNTVQAKVVNPKGNTTWSSSNKKIATVSSKGVIKGKKKGKVTITAVNNGVTMKCKVTVKNLSLNKTKATVTTGYSVKLKLVGAKSKVKWKSSNKTIATVTSKGVVKAKKTGKVTISAKHKGKTYKCKVTVKANERKTNTPYSTSPSAYPLNSSALGIYKVKRDNAGNYILYGHIINNHAQTMESISQLSMVVYCNDKVVAEQTFDRFYVTVGSRCCKEITITINKKNAKKADLRTGKVRVGFKSAGVYLYR